LVPTENGNNRTKERERVSEEKRKGEKKDTIKKRKNTISLFVDFKKKIALKLHEQTKKRQMDTGGAKHGDGRRAGRPSLSDQWALACVQFWTAECCLEHGSSDRENPRRACACDKFRFFLPAKYVFFWESPLRSGSLYASTHKVRLLRSQSPLHFAIRNI